ncbi:hypothetical protein MJ575_01750 [Klebsiella pneumoniae]|nr:hypothetical protein MJ575_01750 [Klebsiella pneumoniae]
MKYHDLRDFLTLTEQQGELKRILCRSILTMPGCRPDSARRRPTSLLFSKSEGYTMPVLYNLFGAVAVALGMGQEDVSSLREFG